MTLPPPHDDGSPVPVRIPQVEQEDRLLGPLTARQVLLLGAVLAVLWAGWLLGRTWLTGLAYLALAAPVAAVGAVAALASRDGMSLDRLLTAAIRHNRAPKRLAPAPDQPAAFPDWAGARWASRAEPEPAPLVLPADDLDQAGVLRLGKDGVCALAACGTVNFGLRTGGEQQALVGAFGRWLNAATGPVQILATARPVDLTAHIDGLRETAAGLPHPALETAAFAHADFLDDLTAGRDLLERRIVLAVRETGRSDTAADRALQRATEAARTLAAADLPVRPLNADQAAAVLASALDPRSSGTANAEAPSTGGTP